MNMDNLNDCIPQDIVAEYILSPVQDILTSIPGVNNETVEQLKGIGINNSFQLIGFFLSFKKENQSSSVLYENIKTYLKNKNVTLEDVTVRSVMEKIDTMIPGFCDLSELM